MKRSVLAVAVFLSVSAPVLASTVDEMKSLSDSVDVLRKNMDSSQNQTTTFLTQVNKRNIMNTNNITELQYKKLNVTTYESGQAKQDKALADETVARIEGDKRNDKALAGKVDNTTYQGDQAFVNENLSALGDNAVWESGTRLEADNKLSDRINDKVDTSAYQTDKGAQKAVNNSVQESLGSKVSSQVFYEAQNNQGAINNQLASSNALTNQRIDNTDATVANLADHSNKEFRRLGREIDSNKKRADAGIAGVAAMASIPSLVNGQRFNVGAGIGNRGGQQAVAVGFTSALNDHTTLKVSTAFDTKHSFTTGAGISYGW